MQLPRFDRRRLRIIGLSILGIVVLLLVVASLLLSFGWGLLKRPVERHLSASLGRPVTVASIRRVDHVSLHPLLSIEGMRVGQPAWAGSGDMLRVRAATVRIDLLSLLFGKPRPELMLLDGVRVALVRDASGRANWKKDGPEPPSGAPPLRLGRVAISDAVVSLDDRQHDRQLTARVTVDARGLRLVGRGTIGGSPATALLTGAPVAQQGAWPFQAEVRSGIVAMRLAGRAAAPLDFGHFTARVTASGRDLRDLDRLIEAGLPASQPFTMAAMVRHDRPAWFITRLKGTLGRSNLTGEVSVHKREGRTLLDGTLNSTGFDFDDLASDRQLAQGRALERVTGPRFLPTTPIHLEKMRRTDGTLRVAVGNLLSRKPTVLRSAHATLTLDHGVLTVAPLDIGLLHGHVTGSAVVRHQSGVPLLLLDLALRDSRIEGILTRDDSILSGPLSGRARIQGHGATIREAMARADGSIGLASRNGAVGRRLALLLGADVGRGIFAGKQEKTVLRCLIARFDARNGVARPAPLLFDTPEARADGSGTITLADERLALDLEGMPKRSSILRLNGPIEARGTIKRPTFNPPPETKNAGGILKMIGKAIGGHSAPLATDADCAGLAARALR